MRYFFILILVIVGIPVFGQEKSLSTAEQEVSFHLLPLTIFDKQSEEFIDSKTILHSPLIIQTKTKLMQHHQNNDLYKPTSFDYIFTQQNKKYPYAKDEWIVVTLSHK